MKKIISGNEAIALSFEDSGGVFASGYPGTPSTETLEEVARLGNVYCEWAPNEKVGLESAIGASLAGGRALATMKHVGVNVAADALMTLTYTGVNAGLILMAADDPGMHSSQNEQDSRNYAKFAKIPMLDPADSQEAYDYVRAGFEISERFDTPVMLRTTTRISHAKGVVEQKGKVAAKVGELAKDVPKYVMLPNFGKIKHVAVEERLLKLQAFAEESPLNRVEMNDPELGIITSGISYQHAKEAFPQASFLKLGLVHPLPEQKIRDFASKVGRLMVVEEMDAIFEEQIRAMGIRVDIGKDRISLCGEVCADIVREAAGAPATSAKTTPAGDLPLRPPTFCPGCAHRGLYSILSKLKVFVSGDIGCYTLGALPPLSAMHTCICMGASISAAHGIAKVNEIAGRTEKPVAVIGDSTFFHSGITGLLSMSYNAGNALVIIMDNRTTGMTGGQENPGSGRHIQGNPAKEVDMVSLVKVLGIENVFEINSYDLKETEAAIRRGLETPGPYVLVDKNPCVLRYRVKKPLVQVSAEKCTGCRACLKASCVALGLKGSGEKPKVSIDPNICNGCGVCSQHCKFDAMTVASGGSHESI
ncbi:indolepyruvate:ferredoxin oxidoreductase, alpha subunit [Citrifermentans bemidjiense Bem]|uniref:Indolepyruvate oxidoreductase subunit IorA n=1 Tax=Citrifermentans bemidjiense (strain ATCC BAA-1014 / DSM 16622 / JCM 12645 / Bem) TaxID=404380 RepID=B5EIS3_CITBB|nr:thiamine pyrophosphate-dependent enzyme [Citrifermentans bemidjiense]ACH38438.1 indolepyruvate:ferredoxin oxidoreductase, alpha subunit [Citrifermentans bemidjiense Bem]